jgi:hypothetical protein
MSAYRAIRLGFFAALLLLVGAGRLAAADSYPFEIRLNSSLFGEKVFTGQIAPENGSFEMFITSGSTRIHMTGSIAGDHSMYGERSFRAASGSAKPFRSTAFSADGRSKGSWPILQRAGARTFTVSGRSPPSPRRRPRPPNRDAIGSGHDAGYPAGGPTAVVLPPEPEPVLTNSQRVEVQQQLSADLAKSNVDGDFGLARARRSSRFSAQQAGGDD